MGHHDVYGHWRAHDKGAYSFGALNDEDQGRGTSGAQVLGVDWWLNPVLAEHLPADVDLEGRVRRVRPHHRSPEVLLSASDRERILILYSLCRICAWQRMCCMKPGFNVHDRSHSALDTARVGRGGTQSALCLEIRVCANACSAAMGGCQCSVQSELGVSSIWIVVGSSMR